ncbi:SHOCT domain-containing protein [Hansschlegelia quercus]|nr:SHOCT domain-containing protein [Hansschlegelia quercus]
MAVALAAGGGAMAQFGHPELGGMGQWSQGGMLMIGDMFNDGLKHRVRGLADELASAMRDGRISAPKASESWGSSRWWPEELGQPSSSGSQNGQRYAVFPDKRRLAIERDGRVTIHDTGDHRIHGASQQQGSNSNLAFNGDLGSVNLSDLPEIRRSPDAREKPSASFETAAQPSFPPSEQAKQPRPAPAAATLSSPASGDPIELIRRLAELRDAGLLSESEFSVKKTELLSRL